MADLKERLNVSDRATIIYKIKVPSNLDDLMRLVVAIANSGGGYIILGIDNKENVVGLNTDNKDNISKISDAINNLTIGIEYSFTEMSEENKNILILNIKESDSTAFFCRSKTSQHRQIAYELVKEDGKNKVIQRCNMTYLNVYKYMSLDVFIISLYSVKWRFFEPSKWNDKFEQRFYCANYNNASWHVPQVFATCLTRAKNSEAAWKVYSSGLGLNSKCVQLELDVVELRKQLRNLGYNFEEKLVEYTSEYEILNLHKIKYKNYSKYFKPFTIKSFLELLSLKRNAYTYEQELRLFMFKNGSGKRNISSKASNVDFNIKWKSVIKKIRIDKNCSEAELIAVQRACFSVGINLIGYNFIAPIKPPIHCKNVEIELFDINEMTGKSRITIR